MHSILTITTQNISTISHLYTSRQIFILFYFLFILSKLSRFALRACIELKYAEGVVNIILDAEKRGTARPFMYNWTINMCADENRHDLTLVLLKSMFEHSPVLMPTTAIQRSVVAALEYSFQHHQKTLSTTSQTNVEVLNRELPIVLRYIMQTEPNLFVPEYLLGHVFKTFIECSDHKSLRSILMQIYRAQRISGLTTFDEMVKLLIFQNSSSLSEGSQVLVQCIKDARSMGQVSIAAFMLAQGVFHLVTKLRAMEASNLVSSEITGGRDSDARHHASSARADPKTISRPSNQKNLYIATTVKEFFTLAREAVNATGINSRTYLLVMLLCKEADLKPLMLEVYENAMMDGAVDGAIQDIVMKTVSKKEAKLIETVGNLERR